MKYFDIVKEKNTSKKLFKSDKLLAESVHKTISDLLSTTNNKSLLKRLVHNSDYPKLKKLSNEFSKIHEKYNQDKVKYCLSFNKYINEIKNKLVNNELPIINEEKIIKKTIKKFDEINSNIPTYSNLLDNIINENNNSSKIDTFSFENNLKGSGESSCVFDPANIKIISKQKKKENINQVNENKFSNLIIDKQEILASDSIKLFTYFNDNEFQLVCKTDNKTNDYYFKFTNRETFFKVCYSLLKAFGEEFISKININKFKEMIESYDNRSLSKRSVNIILNAYNPLFKQIKAVSNNGNWSSDSDNINEEPEPLTEEALKYGILYHGTNTSFDSFDINHQNTNKFGKGFYFTNDKNEAKEYGNNLIKVNLLLNNPLQIKDAYFVNDELLNSIGIKKFDHLDSQDSQNKIKDAGYDSIIVSNVDGNKNLKYYIVFNPEQIKIISNDEQLDEDIDLPNIEIGDEIKIGKYRNKKATIKDYFIDDEGQPNIKTNKGDRKVFGFKIDNDSNNINESKSAPLYHSTSLMEHKIKINQYNKKYIKI